MSDHLTTPVRDKKLEEGKPNIITSVKDSTIALLDDMASQGMIRGNWHDYIDVAASLSELQKMVEQ